MKRNHNDHVGSRLCASENEWSAVAYAMEESGGTEEGELADRIRTHSRHAYEWVNNEPCIAFSQREIGIVEGWRSIALARAMPDW